MAFFGGHASVGEAVRGFEGRTRAEIGKMSVRNQKRRYEDQHERCCDQQTCQDGGAIDGEDRTVTPKHGSISFELGGDLPNFPDLKDKSSLHALK